MRSAYSWGDEPLLRGDARDLRRVLVDARQKEVVLATLALVAGQDVGRDRRVRMPDVRGRVHVVDRCRHIEGHRAGNDRQSLSGTRRLQGQRRAEDREREARRARPAATSSASLADRLARGAVAGLGSPPGELADCRDAVAPRLRAAMLVSRSARARARRSEPSLATSRTSPLRRRATLDALERLDAACARLGAERSAGGRHMTTSASTRTGAAGRQSHRRSALRDARPAPRAQALVRRREPRALRRRERRLGRSRCRRRSSGSRLRLLGSRRRRGRRSGRGSRGGRRRGCRGRVGGTPRREQAEWVDVVSSSPTRMPRWTYGTACSASPDGPGSAIGSPSATMAPLRTRSGPRCVSDALYPSPVTIVTVRPCVGTWPANDTSPARARESTARLAQRDVDPAMLTRGVLVAADRRTRGAPSPSAGHAHAQRRRAGDERPDDSRRPAQATHRVARCVNMERR